MLVLYECMAFLILAFLMPAPEEGPQPSSRNLPQVETCPSDSDSADETLYFDMLQQKQQGRYDVGDSGEIDIDRLELKIFSEMDSETESSSATDSDTESSQPQVPSLALLHPSASLNQIKNGVV